MGNLSIRALLLAGSAVLVPSCKDHDDGPAPTPPGAFSLTLPAMNATGVALNPTYSWTAATGADSYLLQVSTDLAFGTLVIHKPGLVGTSDTPATTLLAGTLYYWRVSAVNLMGTVLASNAPGAFTTQPLPGNFSLSSPANGAANVSLTPTFAWGAASDAATYTLQVSTDIGFGTFAINQSGIATTSHTPAGPLATSTIYYWRVIAMNASGSTTATNAPRSFTTVPPPPGSFSLVSPAAGSTGVALSPTYSWNASSGAATYTVEVSTSSSFATLVVNEPGLTSTSRTPPGSLMTSTVYYWRVTAVNVAGSTLATGAPASFTTAGPPTIALSSSTLSFSASASGPNPPAQPIQVTNPAGGGSLLRWSVSSNRPWLQFSPLSGTTQTETDTVSVSALVSQAEAWTTDTTSTNPPLNRENFSMVWTGSEVIVWGGTWGLGGGAYTNEGARYDPAIDTWTGYLPTAGGPSPRWGHTAVWTGTEMIIWGGRDDGGYYSDGYRFNPRTATWSGPIATNPGFVARRSHSAAWTGTEMIVWGGESGGGARNDGARYNPVGNTWQSMSTSAFATARWHHKAVWTGTEMIVWGGQNGGVLNTGARYDASADSWVGATNTTGAPSPASGASVVWTGTEMIVWGGLPSAGPATNEGARYDPSTNAWLGSTTLTNAPTARRSHEAVWAGSEMIIWGGYNGSGAFYNTGRRYRPPIALAAGTYTGTLQISDPDATNSPQAVTVTFDVTP